MGFRRGLGEEEAHAEGRGDEVGGLVAVDEIQFAGRDLAVLGEGIDNLPGDEVAAVGGLAKTIEKGKAASWVSVVVAGQETEGLGQEGVSGKNGGGLVELDMGGGPAAAQRAVVHAGEVIMDERVGVEALHGNGGGEGIGAGGEEVGGGEEENRAETFSARGKAVPHGCMDGPGFLGFRWHEVDQSGFDLKAVGVICGWGGLHAGCDCH